MNIMQILKEDLCNSTGIATTVFVSGCTHNCKGCHNPESHDFNAGESFNKCKSEIMEGLNSPLCDTLVLTGGDPLCQTNEDIQLLAQLCSVAKNKGYSVWLYTGKTRDELVSLESYDSIKSLLDMVDIAVTGRFIEKERNTSLAFRGSSNQQILRRVQNEWVDCSSEYDNKVV